MKPFAIINRQSGALAGHDPDRALAELVERLAATLPDAEIRVCSGSEMDAEITAALKSQARLIVIGGGDGTVRSAAAQIAGTATVLGIVPLGTVNRLARDLGLALTPLTAAAQLRQLETRTIDVAAVNEIAFLNTSYLGLPIQITREPERLRDAKFSEKIAGYWELLKRLARNQRRVNLEIDGVGLNRPVRAISVAISNNPYDEVIAFPQTRSKLDSGRLAVYVARHRSGLAMLRSFIGTMFGSWRSDPQLDCFEAESIRIVPKSRKRVWIANDGEIAELTAPLSYEIQRRALQVLAPKGETP